MIRAVWRSVAVLLVAGCAKFEQADVPSEAGANDAGTNDADTKDAETKDVDVPHAPARFAYSTSADAGSAAKPVMVGRIVIPGKVEAHSTLVFAVVVDSSGGGEPTVTSTAGAPLVLQSNSAGTAVRHYVYVADDVAGGESVSIDVKTPSPAAHIEMYAHVYTGLAASAVATREKAMLTCAPMVEDCVTTRPLVAPAGSIVFGFSVAGELSAGTGFEPRETLNGNLTEDRLMTTAGEVPVTATVVSGSNAYIHGLVLVPR